MIQAYNYMQESMPYNKKTRYPINKRSELKKLYSDIVKLNKNSPYCKINLSKENQEYTIGLKELALDLKAKIGEISNPVESAFASKTVSVSDNRIMSAELITEDITDLPSSIELYVESTAKAQVNVGRELFTSSRGLPIGEYHFTAHIGEDTYPLVFEHQARTDNQEVLNRMAELLNRSLPGITATVEQGDSYSYKRLKIAADQSGRYGDKSFRFEEEEDDYNISIIEYFDMNRVEQPASFAKFTLNGVEKQTATNTFTLENKLRISLYKSSENRIDLKIVPYS